MNKKRDSEQTKRDRFEVMAVRWAQHFKLSTAEEFSNLPAPVLQVVENMKYCDLVLPLMEADQNRGISLRRIAIKYGFSKSNVNYHLSKNRPKK